MAQAIRPVMLVILDGFGWREETADNAVRQANKPNFDRLWQTCPHAFLRHLRPRCRAAGRPDGQLRGRPSQHRRRPRGDAGTAAHQPGGRRTAASPARRRLVDLIAKLKASGGTCHLMGLLSPGGVHSHQEHAVALAKILHEAGVKTVVHAFTDGRDTPPRSGADDIEWLLKALPQDVPIATVCGRYYAMDRDKRWDRVAKAYAALAEAEAPHIRRCRPGGAGRLRPRRDRRVRHPRLHRRLQGHAGWRRHPVLQFPRRPGARNSRRAAGAGIRRLPAQAGDPVRRRRRDDALLGRTGAVSRRAVPAGEAGPHPGRGGGRSRTHPAAHRGDREIPARHLFPERRAGDAVPRRGPHHGAVAEGRDLRPAAGDVGAGTHRQGGGGDQLRQSTT